MCDPPAGLWGLLGSPSSPEAGGTVLVPGCWVPSPEAFSGFLGSSGLHWYLYVSLEDWVENTSLLSSLHKLGSHCLTVAITVCLFQTFLDTSALLDDQQSVCIVWLSISSSTQKLFGWLGQLGGCISPTSIAAKSRLKFTGLC